MKGFTRREMLAGAAAIGAAGLCGPVLAGQQAAATGLDAVARKRGMRFGSCLAWSPRGADRGSFANPRYAALLERDCGLLVAENEFKWQALRPDARTFDFERFSDMIDYSESKGMEMRGHTLLWHKTERFPRWLNEHDFGATPVKEAERLLTQHIRTACKLYGARIYSFDVVNETIDEKTGGQRESSLSRAMGGADAMCDLAFHTARAHAPHAELVYNDYMSWEHGNDTHRSGVLRLLEGFCKRGVPVDTLGLQSHIGIWSTDSVAVLVGRQESNWRSFLNEAVGMGYKLAITEFDVNDRGLPTDPAVRDRVCADYAKAYLDVTLSYAQLKDILVWGMCDKYSWLNGFSPRDDKTVKRATPYDDRFRAKPMHAAIRQAIEAAPMRPA